ncbi:Na(+)/H(+) antiporter subunit B [Deinococcus aerophilus]|uniref:Cation transporter n=1 Tax=Deinococcus aerophilus TaxID=522488 RepID=A0ABQ2GT08_9DEIO|nr:Na(+)/H(+) antiporter subunit B [Deinococcus aerophilus]GGM11867.1 cation transporter [Deinococcus aerophilus]
MPKRSRPTHPSRPAPPRPGDLLLHDPILRTISRAAFALVMLFALLLLWRGHNAPGGGFIAGLMTVCALILHRIANNQSALRLNPAKLVPWGLALSLTTGLVPYLLGLPFLKSDYGYVTTALTGEFEWATALFFDLGVYLVVVGAGLSLAYALIDVQPNERVEGDG